MFVCNLYMNIIFCEVLLLLFIVFYDHHQYRDQMMVVCTHLFI